MAWFALGVTTREINDETVVVGSGAEVEWRVSTADLAPRHLVVEVRDRRASVRASSPDNVVVLNGKQIGVEPQPLGDGDVVFAGSGRFVFTIEPPGVTLDDDPALRHGFLVDDEAKIAHPLLGRSTTIGRDASNAIVVRDPTASRFHAEVRREAGGFVLHSIGATGTMVNARPLASPRVLGEGDTLEIAFAKLRFTATPPSGDTKLATPHSTKSDETARRATIGGSSGVVVDEQNEAGRDTRRLQLLVGLVVVLAAAWWFGRSFI
jgi:predicted component of type VI protein secretion system